MQRRDFYFSLVLIALGGGVIVESLRMPRESGYGTFAAPGLVPGILGAVLAFFGLLLLIRAARAGGWRRESAAPADPDDKTTVGALAITVGLIVVYAVVLVGSVPFWLASFLFLFAFVVYFEWQPAAPPKQRARALGTAFAQAAAVAFAVTYLFENIFRVNLPG